MTLKANWFQTSVSPLVDARDERRLLRALRPTGGIVLPGDFAVTPVGAGTTLNVNVAACSQGGGAVVPGLDTHQGAYFVYNDAAVQVPVAVADPTNPRIDTVVLRIYDDEVTPGSGFAVAVEMARGAPNANPVQPVLPRDSIPLADVRVNANATGIGAGNITDRRVAIHGGSLVRGITAQGAAANQPGVNSLIPLDTVLEGASAWLNPANGTITIPPGAGGLYLIAHTILYRSDAIVGMNTEIVNTIGQAFAPAMKIGGSVNPSTANAYLNGVWVRQCAAGDTFKVLSRGNQPAAPGFIQNWKFSLVRLADALLAAPGVLQQPAPPLPYDEPLPTNPDAAPK